MHYFGKSLKAGKVGENVLRVYFTDVVQLDGRESDFVLKDSVHRIELKTDYYDEYRTPNFFMERYSNIESQSPGGPWQALEKGSDYFCYLFIRNLSLYVFDTAALVTRLNYLVDESAVRCATIPNIKWDTFGYLVKRSLLEPLGIKQLRHGETYLFKDLLTC